MAGLISPTAVEQIRAASDIVDVIGGYLPLKHAGANFVTLCPFHKEKTPSFNVSPHKQIFHCFGCHKGGDVFTFVQEYENISFAEVLRRLADRAGIPLEYDRDPDHQKTRHLKETLFQIHEQITQRWHRLLTNDAAGQIGRDYLAKRGVSDDAVKLFHLGYTPDAWDDTVNWAKSKGYELPVVEQAGLIIRKEGESRYYDRFRGRLMFPICDEQGRVIAFSGRILSGDEKTAKYVNSPETALFTKGKVIFGLDKSKRALLDASCAIICEGQLDLIACFMAGVQNVVAPQGTALTAEHTRILKRSVEEVVLCFDSDTAGQNAAIRALDDLLASGLAVRVATIPAPHDPDSFIKANGTAAFKKLIEQAEGFFDFYLNRLCSTNDVSTDKGQSAVLNDMAEAVHKTGNLVLVDKYAQKTALRLAVSPDAVRAEFRKAHRHKPASPPAEREAEAATQDAPRPSPQEFRLMKLLLIDDEPVDWAVAHLDLNWVRHPTVRQVLSLRFAAHANGAWRGVATMVTELDNASARSLVTEALSEQREIPNRGQQIADVILRLRNQFIDQQLMALKQRDGTAGLSSSEQGEFLRLHQAKRQPLEALPRQP